MFLLSTVLATFIATTLYLLLFLTLIQNFSIVSFSRSLNKLNVSGTYYEIIPIDIAQNPEFRALLSEVMQQ